MPTADGFAEPAEVATFAEQLADNFLECRLLQHNWRPFTARWNSGAYDVVHRCNRCYTRRVQVINARGFVIKSHYEYAEGYQHEGLGRIVGDGRAALRLESVQRVVAITNERDEAKEARKSARTSKSASPRLRSA